jgi:hypothetical protein
MVGSADEDEVLFVKRGVGVERGFGEMVDLAPS